MSFWSVIVPYYESRLQHYERLDLARCGEEELLAIALEASALLREGTGAADPLQGFLGVALEILGPPPECEWFCLVSEATGKTYRKAFRYRVSHSRIRRPSSVSNAARAASSIAVAMASRGTNGCSPRWRIASCLRPVGVAPLIP